MSAGGPSSDFEPGLHGTAGLALIFVEGVTVDVQRGGRLGVAEEPRHRGHVCAARDQETLVGMDYRQAETGFERKIEAVELLWQ